MKKSCLNCKHLEWVDGDTHDPSGYACNKRKYRSESEEWNHLGQLEKDAYLNKGKSCCDVKSE